MSAATEAGAQIAAPRAPASVRVGAPLAADFYARPVLEVARDLIGCVVEHGGVSGVIVETEAYHESEPACHAFVGVTPRTRTLFAEPGTAYVYRSYGIHALLNAVCEPSGVGAAVLIRALEPLSGIDAMCARRGGAVEGQLCSGPGKLTQALGIELRENGTSLVDGPVRIRAGGLESVSARTRAGRARVAIGTRIGISKAVDLRWRFCLAGNRHVSRPQPAG
ncbi:MAG TPA: DNA-3-methyladenine glycosylase [Solirubrobacteraceae bacterium]|jgi:DNA-3-methyladenine glycosylase|nr:DNA-3-methyladenine glycosylase [Solirubrobacteraceae bacterium]